MPTMDTCDVCYKLGVPELYDVREYGIPVVVEAVKEHASWNERVSPASPEEGGVESVALIRTVNEDGTVTYTEVPIKLCATHKEIQRFSNDFFAACVVEDGQPTGWELPAEELPYVDNEPDDGQEEPPEASEDDGQEEPPEASEDDGQEPPEEPKPSASKPVKRAAKKAATGDGTKASEGSKGKPASGTTLGELHKARQEHVSALEALNQLDMKQFKITQKKIGKPGGPAQKYDSKDKALIRAWAILVGLIEKGTRGATSNEVFSKFEAQFKNWTPTS